MGAGQERRGRGNTGTSQELNRTANSSTRVGEGGQIALRYATHTYTHTKKTGHKLHFLPKLRPRVTSVHSSRGRGSCGRLASAFLRILHTLLRQACVGEGPSPETLEFPILAAVGRKARSRLPQEVARLTGSSQNDGRRSGGRSARYNARASL